MSEFCLPLNKLEPEREKWLSARNQMLVQADSDPKKQALKELLRKAAGEAAIIPRKDDDIDAILDRAFFCLGRSILRVDGVACHCHMNAAIYWKENNDYCQLMTGYALSDDGVWRQHSWCLLIRDPKTKQYIKPIIVETTEDRLLYFGFEMSSDEAEQFYLENAL